MEVNRSYDTTEDIWERSFRCLVSQKQTTSEDYYKIFGQRSTGSKKHDKAIPDQYVDTYISIAKMVEYFQQGVTIQVYNYDDCKTIYEIIERHLRRWQAQFAHGINIGDAPVDDLIAMDEFANKIYDKAKYLIKPDIVNSLAVQQMSSISSLSRSAFYSRIQEHNEKNNPTLTKAQEQEKYPERASLAPVFKSSIAGFAKWK